MTDVTAPVDVEGLCKRLHRAAMSHYAEPGDPSICIVAADLLYAQATTIKQLEQRLETARLIVGVENGQGLLFSSLTVEGGHRVLPYHLLQELRAALATPSLLEKPNG